jgi:hypothetical protein
VSFSFFTPNVPYTFAIVAVPVTVPAPAHGPLAIVIVKFPVKEEEVPLIAKVAVQWLFLKIPLKMVPDTAPDIVKEPELQSTVPEGGLLVTLVELTLAPDCWSVALKLSKAILVLVDVG